jgi:hypothetical protein
VNARRLLSLLGAVCIFFGVGTSPAAALTDRGAGAITSVTFTGTPAKLTITIVGRGLTIPAPSPANSPSNQPLCPKVIQGNAGLDYGTRFYVTAFANEKLKYAAGRYRPSLNELDCIGIVVLSHTSTRVQFGFGAAYTQADFGYPHIVNGDLVEVVLNGAAYGLVVRYHH